MEMKGTLRMSFGRGPSMTDKKEAERAGWDYLSLRDFVTNLGGII